MQVVSALVLIAILFGQTLGAATPETASDDPRLVSLRQAARLWVVKKRDDLALDALRRAQLIAPDDPALMVEISLIGLRNGNMQEAQSVLQKLETQHPDARATQELRDMLRLATTDRRNLATAVFLGKKAPKERIAMLPVLKSLFDEGHRMGESGLLYYHLLGRIPGHQLEAVKGLTGLQKTMPGDARPLLEIAIIKVNDEKTRTSGLDTLVTLSQRDDVDAELLQKAFEDGLSETERTPKTEPYFKAFSARFPDLEVPQLVLSEADLRQRAKDQQIEKATQIAHMAERQAAAGHLEAAESDFKHAIDLDPEDSEYPLQLAKLYQKGNKMQEALETYRRVLLRRPQEERAASGLMTALAATGNTLEAIRWGQAWLVKNVSHDALRDAWITLIRDESARQMETGDKAGARALLEEGMRVAQGSGWIRYDLAQLDASEGHPERGRARFNGAPSSPQVSKAEALYLSEIGDDAAALALLERIDGPQKNAKEIRSLRDRLALRKTIQEALREDQAGQHQAAVKKLRAECPIDATSEGGWQCASAFADIGEENHALALARRLTQRHTPPAVEDEVRYAELLSGLRADLALDATLRQLESRKDTTPAEQADISDLRIRATVREAWALRRQREAQRAMQHLEEALRTHPNDPHLSSALADMKLLAKDSQAAVAIYRHALAAHPQSLRLQASLAEALWIDGETSEALSLMDRLEGEIPLKDREDRIYLARDFILSEQIPRAEAILEGVRAEKGTDPATALALAKAEKKAQHYERSLSDLKTLLDRPADSLSKPVASDDRLEALELEHEIRAQRFGYFSSGVDVRELAGTPGISQIINVDSPNLIRVADGYDGHYFFQTDFAGVFAGNLGLWNFGNAAQFGTVNALCTPGKSVTGPVCANGTVLPTEVNQQAFGGSIGAGYEWDHWRIDLGSTPIGFPVSNVVGGIHHTGSLGDGYYSVEVFRRPMPNSLLSYAGARDPVTGSVWGGVTYNGGGFYTGSDLFKTEVGTLSGFFQASGQYLEGTRVQSNAEGMTRTGLDWNFIETDDMNLSLGLAGMFLSFANNQRHYTYGYGGYWSPQIYTSASIPLQFQGREGDLSYHFRGYVAYSYSSENASPLYPNDPALQYSPLNQNAYYSSLSGTAVSYGIRLKTEYRVSPEFFVGAHFEKAQSPFYTPNYGGLYMRYAFDENDSPMAFPPENPQPYYRW